jgi:hypothetical protein
MELSDHLNARKHNSQHACSARSELSPTSPADQARPQSSKAPRRGSSTEFCKRNAVKKHRKRGKVMSCLARCPRHCCSEMLPIQPTLDQLSSPCNNNTANDNCTPGPSRLAEALMGLSQLVSARGGEDGYAPLWSCRIEAQHN